MWGGAWTLHSRPFYIRNLSICSFRGSGAQTLGKQRGNCISRVILIRYVVKCVCFPLLNLYWGLHLIMLNHGIVQSSFKWNYGYSIYVPKTTVLICCVLLGMKLRLSLWASNFSVPDPHPQPLFLKELE